MNGPKVRKVLSKTAISQDQASRMLAKFLSRERQETVLSESLARLEGICARIGNPNRLEEQNVVEAKQEDEAETPTKKKAKKEKKEKKKKRKRDSTGSEQKQKKKKAKIES